MEYAGDDYYTTAGAYYYVESADAQEQLGGSQAGGLASFDPLSYVCASLLKAKLV